MSGKSRNSSTDLVFAKRKRSRIQRLRIAASLTPSLAAISASLLPERKSANQDLIGSCRRAPAARIWSSVGLAESSALASTSGSCAEPPEYRCRKARARNQSASSVGQTFQKNAPGDSTTTPFEPARASRRHTFWTTSSRSAGSRNQRRFATRSASIASSNSSELPLHRSGADSGACPSATPCIESSPEECGHQRRPNGTLAIERCVSRSLPHVLGRTRDHYRSRDHPIRRRRVHATTSPVMRSRLPFAPAGRRTAADELAAGGPNRESQEELGDAHRSSCAVAPVPMPAECAGSTPERQLTCSARRRHRCHPSKGRRNHLDPGRIRRTRRESSRPKKSRSDPARRESTKRIGRRYLRRWQIEVIHRTLKSGWKVEQRQSRTAESLQCALAVDVVVPWRVMMLARRGREIPDVSWTA